jgi:hypothetical protein
LLKLLFHYGFTYIYTLAVFLISFVNTFLC